MRDICIVGAGLSGAVVARELAQAGFECHVFESRSHVAGNCHTERDTLTGVMAHVYGPHIFHTNDETVWNYIRTFGEFMPYTNRVKAVAKGRVYSFPINLLTINQFFGKALNPREAQSFLASQADHTIHEPRTFEEQALRFVGKDLYEAFFKGYTIKQWGVDPAELPASVLKRLPVRFTYDDNYYDSRFQGLPKNGYTDIVERILDHPNIKVYLHTKITPAETKGYSHTFYTGPLDEWFAYSGGRLGYRTLDFAIERFEGDYQGNAVINYCDAETPWTRVSEHKYFSAWETHSKTLVYREYSRSFRDGDIPFYPMRLANDRLVLDRYRKLAEQEHKVTFMGRLGTYRYLDMDVCIAEALNVSKKFIAGQEAMTPLGVLCA
ncbi:MAG TPA: UDP-galactopyranose mutase [Terriglobia bacterium]|nr:UDP-galactopyranose mutase [Terriglobia bacterium]